MYKVRFPEFVNITKQIATGMFEPTHVAALDIMRKCVYAQKGLEKRDITTDEAAKLLKR